MNTIHRTLFAFLGVLLSFLAANAQTTAVKTNALYWLTSTPNIGIETLLAPKWTGSFTVGYNPFSFSDNKKIKHILLQPEVRYWLCAPYAGHAIGINALYSHYNAGGIDFPLGILYSDLENYRYQGDIGAIGITYSYSWILGMRWSLEASLGIGVGLTHYKQYNCEKCGTHIGSDTKALLMPTKVALSVIYNIE